MRFGPCKLTVQNLNSLKQIENKVMYPPEN